MKKKLSNFWQSRIILLVIINLILFVYSMRLRAPWFGALGGSEVDTTGHHQWLTGSTIVFTNNWRELGPDSIGFSLLQAPISVETKVNNYFPYISYPPGTILPIYIVSQILDRPADPEMVMGYNLFGQLVTGIFVSLSAYLLLRKLSYGRYMSTLISTMPPIVIYFLPGPMYWMQNVFFSDQAVIPIVSFYLFLELLKDLRGRRYYLLQSLAMFLMMLTDWLGVFVILFVFINRLIRKEIKRKTLMYDLMKFGWPAILAISLFGWQVYKLDMFENLWNKFIFRANLAGDAKAISIKKIFLNRIIEHGKTGYGKLLFPGLVAWFISGLALVKKSDYRYYLYISLLFVLPFITQLLVLSNHTTIHDFSFLKIVFPFGLAVMTMLPALYLSNAKNTNVRNILLLGYVIIALIYVYRVGRRYIFLFPAPNYEYEEIGKFIKENTTYTDILVSPDYEIPINPPQKQAYSGKLVYQIDSIEEIEKLTAKVQGDYQLKIFIKDLENMPDWLVEYPAEVMVYRE